MKKPFVLYVWLLIAATVLTTASGQSWERDDAFKAFWHEFKTAINNGDKETIIRFSRFPIRMPGRVPPIRNAAELRLRYREVFNKRTNAGKCFGGKLGEPVGQSEADKLPKGYAVFCDADSAHGEPVVYSFKLTKTGWKFVELALYDYPD